MKDTEFMKKVRLFVVMIVVDSGSKKHVSFIVLAAVGENDMPVTHEN